MFLGRNPSMFYIQLHSTRSQGRRGDVAVDQLEFRDCALPSKNPGGKKSFILNEASQSVSLSSFVIY